MKDIIEKTRQFLKDNKIDYMLVNSTNEFLVEYAPLSENSRYVLTNFSGSTGDAVISAKEISLFVDGRYHEQAEFEVDQKQVTVIKMKIGESFTKLLEQKLQPNKTFAVVSKKNSKGRLEILENALAKKNIKIKLLDFDPIEQNFSGKKIECKKNKAELIDFSITGLDADEKFRKTAAVIDSKQAILLTNLEEISYLCNLRDFSNNYSSKIAGKCLITKDCAILFTDFDIKIGKQFKTERLKNFEQIINNLQGITTIFVDKSSINIYDYNLLGKKAMNLKENLLKKMKSIKTDLEIEHYKKCFKRTDKSLMAVRDFIENNENISEYDIAKKLEESFYKFGAKSLSFKSIVAKDKNAALAHYSKDSKTEVLKEGSLVLIDCGAYYEGGYATDITRVFVKGSPSHLQKEVYTIVLKGVLKAFNKKITPKTSGFLLDKAARKVLEENKPEGFEFSHSLGHGIGISVHESPPSLAFSPLAKTPLSANMCFTIEPGLYNPKHFGVRLENSCYLSDESGKLIVKSFTNMCFEKKLIDYSLLSSTEKNQLKFFEVK